MQKPKTMTFLLYVSLDLVNWFNFQCCKLVEKMFVNLHLLVLCIRYVFLYMYIMVKTNYCIFVCLARQDTTLPARMIAAPTTQHDIVASQEGVYPNYAKSSSTCLGIFHFIISAMFLAISIAEVFILGNNASTKSSMVSTVVLIVLVSIC